MTQHRLVLIGAAIALAACTYNEYRNNYYQVVEPDAGAPLSQAGRGGSSGSGGGAGASGSGGSAGSSQAGSAGASAETSCAGCVRLGMPANPPRSIGLAFDDEQNLSTTQLSWRLRLRDFNDPVFISLYAESGSREDERLFLGSFSLAAADGWQTFGADLAGVEPFRVASFIDAGEGAGGGGFDSGFPFDKSEIERIAVQFATSAPGVFTPLVVEIDSVRFSNRNELDREFAGNDGGLEVISLFDTPIEGATLVHVAE